MRRVEVEVNGRDMKDLYTGKYDFIFPFSGGLCASLTLLNSFMFYILGASHLPDHFPINKNATIYQHALTVTEKMYDMEVVDNILVIKADQDCDV